MLEISYTWNKFVNATEPWKHWVELWDRPGVNLPMPGWSDPAPMTPPVPFGMNSSSSQLLDMLQALRLGQFYLFFPSLTSRLPIKEIYSTAQAFQTLTTYFRPTENPKPRHHSRAKTTLQKMVLQKQCWSVEVLLQKTMLQMQCWSNVAEDDFAKAVLKQCYKGHSWSGVVENILPKDKQCIYGK